MTEQRVKYGDYPEYSVREIFNGLTNTSDLEKIFSFLDTQIREKLNEFVRDNKIKVVTTKESANEQAKMD